MIWQTLNGKNNLIFIIFALDTRAPPSRIQSHMHTYTPAPNMVVILLIKSNTISKMNVIIRLREMVGVRVQINTQTRYMRAQRIVVYAFDFINQPF